MNFNITPPPTVPLIACCVDMLSLHSSTFELIIKQLKIFMFLNILRNFPKIHFIIFLVRKFLGLKSKQKWDELLKKLEIDSKKQSTIELNIVKDRMIIKKTNMKWTTHFLLSSFDDVSIKISKSEFLFCLFSA